MKRKPTFLAILWVAVIALTCVTARAQVYIDWDDPVPVQEADSLLCDTLAIDSIDVSDIVMPAYVYTMPLVFTHMQQLDTVSPLKRTITDDPALQWVEKELYKIENVKRMRQNIFVYHPDKVKYNINTLPEPPRQYIAVADPEHAVITIEELHADVPDNHEVPAEEKRIIWLNNFTGNVQFSQAYNSPNWYQGGNSHLNLLVNASYNLKLNQKFYPNLLFDFTVQYKLAVNSTPDDSLRKYNISEELFQINSKFGVRAAKKWFYTLTMQFKTQFLNNYEANTNNMTASFLSPGDLNVGLGMTYNYENPKKTVQFAASLSPLSYNLRTCINRRMDPTQYDIKPGHKSVSQIGSSAEVTLDWKIAYNISLKSRLFVFSDYSYVQGDWENTIAFTINKYLSTNLYVHLRYDSSTPPLDDSRWHYWQLREVLSFGFSYTFATV